MNFPLKIDTANQLAETPSWLGEWRAKGQESLSLLEWPTRRTEAWRYTPLKSISEIEWQKNTAQSATSGIDIEQWDAAVITIANGSLVGEVNLPQGVNFVPFAELDEAEGSAALEKVERSRAGFLFDQINQAVLDNGYLLTVDKNAQVSKPIHINYVVDGDRTQTSSVVIIDAAERSNITVAETFANFGERVFVNPLTLIHVGPSALVNHYHLLLEEGDVRHVGRVAAELSRYAKLNSFHMAVGGTLKRKDVTVRHLGEGAELILNGVALPRQRQIIDYHTTLDHEVPHCDSQEIFRTIVADQGKAVFNGRIHIHQDAQKSNAELNNKNLLLSDQAEVDTKPELEIYADDVKCAHGATIARLDAQQLFYFQARGISRQEAEVMLSFGFINELLEALQDEPIRNLLRPKLIALFGAENNALTRHLG